MKPVPSVRLPALALAAGLFAFGSLVLTGCGASRPATSSSSDPRVVATYAGERLTRTDFEERYARAVGGRAAAADSSSAAHQDFLQRYVDFRLKVREAERLGLDRLPAVRTEVEQYRQNLARPYLLEQEVIEPVVRLLYERQGQVVDASHVLVQVGQNASPADTLAAYRKMLGIVDSVRAGMPFATAAQKFSDDPSARGTGPGASGRLGYFSGGDMVDAFEDAAYATASGQMSPVLRTQYGYHVLFVHDRRPTPEEIHVAHIMIRPEGTEPAQKAAAQARATAIRDSVLAGVDFARLASQHSADQGSAPRGGDLGWVPFQAPLVEPFKSTAFALQNPGDLAAVTETQYGFHVIKLIERRPRPTLETAYTDLKQAAARLPRARVLQDAYAARLRRERGARVDTAFVAGLVAGLSSDSLLARLAGGYYRDDVRARVIATVGDSSYTFGQLADFSATRRTDASGDAKTVAARLLDPFLNERTIDVEAARLEQDDAEFARTMRDFRDGIVLFRLMEDSVWTRASQDSVGLMNLYRTTAAGYRFPDRTRVLTVVSTSDSLLTRVSERLAAGATFASLMADQAARPVPDLRFDTVLVAGTTGSVYDRAVGQAPGARVGPLPYQGAQRILMIHDGTEPARPKLYDEAKPELVTAYQKMLEDRMIARLRARYNARLYPARLAGAFSTPAPATPPASTSAR